MTSSQNSDNSDQPPKPKRRRRAFVATYIYDSLRQAIVDGVYAIGARLPSENELCTQFSASRMTVRGALKRLGSDRMIESQPGRGWRVLSAQPSPEINVKGPILAFGNRTSPNNAAMECALEELENHGIAYERTGKHPDEEWFRHNSHRKFGGFLVFSGRVLEPHIAAKARELDIPLVCMMLAKQENYDTVSPDHAEGTRIALQRIWDQGYRRIGYISNETLDSGVDPSFAIRREAYEKFVKDKGMKSKAFLSKYHYAFDKGDGQRFGRWLGTGEKRPDAVFCTTSGMIEFAFVQLELLGLSASKDVLVSGASLDVHKSLLKNHKMKKMLGVATRGQEVGRVAAARLIQRLQGDTTPPSLTLLPPNIENVEGMEDKGI